VRAAGLAALLGALGAVSASAEVVTIRQFGFYFSPREVVINPGDTVRWTWSSGSHTVTEGTDGTINGNEAFHAPLTSATPQYEVAFTPAFLAANPRPGGRYDYFCQPHFSIGMNGVVWVAEPPPGSAFCSGDGLSTACPCGVPGPTGSGCPNSVFEGARLRAIGSASVGADTLRLWMTGAPEGTSVIFFQGASLEGGGLGRTFGEGLRCAGPTLVRLGQKWHSFNWSRYPDPGDAPISVSGFVTPGTTRHYQAWYQDSPGLCGPPVPNFSNGYTVVWQ
jgi:plastocyanin